ncbi:MAG: exodeoxyribonuclease VII small subunit [Lachnospiraceae bacterium]|nr:exodeoxyribonuclease VII small subunit [Lachnospiraceae bacterium]
MDKKNDKEKAMSVEEGFSKLEDILGRMEDPEVELEDSFLLYEEGVKLLKELNGRIDTVEKKVMELKEDGSLTAYKGEDEE